LTIEEVAEACWLQVDDTSRTLTEFKLSTQKRKDGSFIVTSSIVERVAKEFKVKRKILDERYLLL
jgi:hypothetical protein